MKCHTVKIHHASRSDVFRIVLIADLHLGNRACDEKLIAKCAASLSDPNTYWIFLGDAVEAINRNDRRFDPKEMADWLPLQKLDELPEMQTERFVSYFEPYADSCLAILAGNHEDKIRRMYDHQIYKNICEKLHIPPEARLGYCGFLKIDFKRSVCKGTMPFIFFLHHGAGGGALPGAKALRLGRLPMSYDADFYCVGHTHTKMAFPVKRKKVVGGRVVDRQAYCINTGSFLSGEDVGYVQRAGLYPQGLGPVTIEIRPDDRRRDISVIL